MMDYPDTVTQERQTGQMISFSNNRLTVNMLHTYANKYAYLKTDIGRPGPSRLQNYLHAQRQ